MTRPADPAPAEQPGSPGDCEPQGSPRDREPQGSLGDWENQLRWNEEGLAPVVTQDYASGRVLTVAWMNREALRATAARGEAVYWSRSRRKLWHKGEQSGHVQKVRELRLDCDADAILLRVDQQGGIACHTGRESCFYRRYEGGRWVDTDPVLRDPALIYGKKP